MIEVRLGELHEEEAEALVRPVATDFTAVTPAMRRFEQAAGDAVAEQCRMLGEIPPGSAVITAPGELGAEVIVHVAVRSSTENATRPVVRLGLINALRRLTEWEASTVAMAPLGTGAGNLDAETSADLMLEVLAEHVAETGRPERVTLVVEDAYQEAAFTRAVARHMGGQASIGT